MKTALQEIYALRKGKEIVADTMNSNKYCIIADESGDKTVYCFSTPIYDAVTRKLVYRSFDRYNNTYMFAGSNAKVTVNGNTVVLKNIEGSAMVSLPDGSFALNDGLLCGDSFDIVPTFNGFMLHSKMPCIKIRITTENPFLTVKCNSKYFALMQDVFSPFINLAALIAYSKDGVARPVNISYNAIDSHTYEVEFSANDCNSISFEVNLYERKLFQDTTVESIHPYENNAFGSTAFLGNTMWYGDQWLYSRLDASKLSFLQYDNFTSVCLHMPCLYNHGKRIFAYSPAERFCSFGSTWDNKKDIYEPFAFSTKNCDYATIDLSEVIKGNQHSFFTNGIAMKCSTIENSYTVLSTGDSYAYPQILEVKYKNT